MMLTKTKTFFSLCLCASVVIFSSCSQNEVKVKGPKPQAPANPRVAQEVKKDAAGMMAAAPAMPPQEETAPAAASGPAAFPGTVILPGPLEAKFKPGEALFVIARSAEEAKPVAAQRLSPEKFPAPFTLTAADSMTGEALPPKVEIIVRLDADGDIATKGPDDLVGGPVPASAGKAVTVTLEEPKGK